jgi:nucleoside-triphosphatase THEP1
MSISIGPRISRGLGRLRVGVRIVTGGRDAGKTRWMQELAERSVVWGFISAKVFAADGAFAGYDLVELPHGDVTPLARLGGAGGADAREEAGGAGASGDPGALGERWFRFRRFLFNRAAFDRATEQTRGVLAGNGLDPQTIFVLDEIGPLEVAGGGFRRVLERFSAGPRPLVVTTRTSLVAWLGQLTGAAREDVIDLGS